MNKWSKLFFGFLFVIIALSVIGFVFNVVVSLALFAFQAFIFFSIGFFVFKFVQSLFGKNKENA